MNSHIRRVRIVESYSVPVLKSDRGKSPAMLILEILGNYLMEHEPENMPPDLSHTVSIDNLSITFSNTE